MSLFFLKVLLDASLDPDDAADENQRHRREDHETVVDITCRIEAFRDDSESEQGAGAEEFTEESHHNEDEAVAHTVGESVKKGRKRLVAKGERLDTSHDDTVGDDQTDVD